MPPMIPHRRGGEAPKPEATEVEMLPLPEPASEGCNRALPSGYSGALRVNPPGNVLVFASKSWK